MRIADPTRMMPVITKAIDTLSVCWFRRPTGTRIQTRLKADAIVRAARACPREATTMPRPRERSGGPGIFPRPVFAKKPQAVRASPATAARRPAARASLERSRVPGSGRSRIARTMFRRLTRQEATRLVDHLSEVPAANAPRTAEVGEWEEPRPWTRGGG